MALQVWEQVLANIIHQPTHTKHEGLPKISNHKLRHLSGHLYEPDVYVYLVWTPSSSSISLPSINQAREAYFNMLLWNMNTTKAWKAYMQTCKETNQWHRIQHLFGLLEMTPVTTQCRHEHKKVQFQSSNDHLRAGCSLLGITGEKRISHHIKGPHHLPPFQLMDSNQRRISSSATVTYRKTELN